MESYTTDYDIVGLHFKVLEVLQDDVNKVKDIDIIISDLNSKIKKCEKVTETYALQNKLDSMLDTRAIYAVNSRMDKYMKSVSEYITSYEMLRSYCDTDEVFLLEYTDTVVNHRVNIIDNYLNIAGQYCIINIKKKRISKYDICPSCGAATTKDSCLVCGLSEDPIYNIIGNPSKHYDTVSYFMKCVKCFMGTQTTEPFSEVLEAIDKYCSRTNSNYLSPEKVRQLPLNSDGTRGTYTMSHFVKLLRLVKFNKRNIDKHLIVRSCWGWRLYDVTHLLPEICKRATEIQREYVLISNKSSNMNREFLCFKIFQMLAPEIDLAVTSAQFDLITTDNILVDYEVAMQKICKKLGPSYSYIPLKGTSTCKRIIPVDEGEQDEMTSLSTDFSKKYKTILYKFVDSLINVIIKLRQNDHISMPDSTISILKDHLASIDEIALIDKMGVQMFSGSEKEIRERMVALMNRDMTFFKKRLTNVMPTDPTIRELTDPLVQRLLYLLTAKTETLDNNGEKIPVISLSVINMLWKYIDVLLDNCINHYRKTGNCPGCPDFDMAYEVVSEKGGFLEYRSGSVAK